MCLNIFFLVEVFSKNYVLEAEVEKLEFKCGFRKKKNIKTQKIYITCVHVK